MNSDINKFLALQTALVNEKAKLEARLGEISKVLGQDVSVAAPSPAPASPALATTTTNGKRTFSAATRAKMAASQKLGIRGISWLSWCELGMSYEEKRACEGLACIPERAADRESHRCAPALASLRCATP